MPHLNILYLVSFLGSLSWVVISIYISYLLKKKFKDTYFIVWRVWTFGIFMRIGGAILLYVGVLIYSKVFNVGDLNIATTIIFAVAGIGIFVDALLSVKQLTKTI